MRVRGKEEYKYVSGDTSEHGGELESQKNVLPLYSQVSEDFFFSSKSAFLHPSCTELKSVLHLSEGAEVMRKNVSIAKKAKQENQSREPPLAGTNT